MPILFDPANWYWIVGQDTTRVFSSAAAAYVPTRDATYVAWQADPSHVTSRIGSEQELWDYLNGRALNATPSTGTSTDAAKQRRIDEQLSEVIYQVAFFHENRLRALEAQPPVTQEQFIARIKGLMK